MRSIIAAAALATVALAQSSDTSVSPVSVVCPAIICIPGVPRIYTTNTLLHSQTLLRST
jgi:hypothetical protein